MPIARQIPVLRLRVSAKRSCKRTRRIDLAMGWRPEPTDKPIWSAAGGVMTIVGATVTPLLALAPASAHVPSWSVFLCAVIGSIGFYVMVAPLLRWWPWSESVFPHPFVPMGVVIAVVVVVVHGGRTHTASGNSAKRKPGPPARGQVQLPRAVTYHGKGFTARLPRGWGIEENEVNKSGEKQSAWTRVSEPRDKLLIDFSPASNLTLEQDAASVHEVVLHEEGSRELYYGAGDLSGVKSWMWIFRRPNTEMIDYFFNRCSTGFAVLGATSPERFTRLRPIVRAVAESVKPSCG
jgi:hypothetical protein